MIIGAEAETVSDGRVGGSGGGNNQPAAVKQDGDYLQADDQTLGKGAECLLGRNDGLDIKKTEPELSGERRE
jgi:hypothetical protein